jgi:hypothetical protein
MRTQCFASAAAAALALCAGAAFAQPANDNCSSPQAISGFGQTTFDSTGATTDGPATGCTGANANNDIWFLWTATADGNVQVDFCTGTNYDTVVTVYDGPGCPSGNEIACDDDTCGNRSKTQFAALSGHQYLIRVSGYFATSFGPGVMTIGVAPPAGVIFGPVVNEANGHTYLLLEPSSWTAAEARAVELGGHLATVRSDEENVYIFNEIRGFDGSFRRVWIGLNDVANEGTFVWSSGEPVTFTNWGAGEPNNAGGVENFVQIPWFSQLWNDNSDLPGDDPCCGVVEIIPAVACAADIGSTGGVPGVDGHLDNNDFVVFIDYFFNQNPLADRGSTGGVPGSDGQWNNNDFVVFIDQFFTGC